ncbi:hypothetical protein D9613_000882 [Agrocybe pediades]|uniref:Uncharacterized protein n=1 Tax=Agrocybe pediades TaxID=84607 RepID=A0A8H4VSS1_9AGAR|nr:hypothetical protein D9613_000882 [Agrocybe pediades]
MKAFRQKKPYPPRPQPRFISSPISAATTGVLHEGQSVKADGEYGYYQYPKEVTQEEQDQEDEKNRKEAIRDLVESWMDRLQLISVITTFFASTEASMITITAPSSDGTPISVTSQIANMGIMGALVVHSNAAIISFLAAFLLVRYKLMVATKEEEQIERHDNENGPHGKVVNSTQQFVNSPTSMSFDGSNHTERASPTASSRHGPHRLASSHRDHDMMNHETDPTPGMIRIPSRIDPNRTVYSKNPHLVQVGPFDSYGVPTHIISRCHNLCIFLTVLGFVLALTGILCFAWDRLPLSVSISSSFFMATCLIAGVYVWVKPESRGQSSHIYCDMK